jgi:hypothetical protein
MDTDNLQADYQGQKWEKSILTEVYYFNITLSLTGQTTDYAGMLCACPKVGLTLWGFFFVHIIERK